MLKIFIAEYMGHKSMCKIQQLFMFFFFFLSFTTAFAEVDLGRDSGACDAGWVDGHSIGLGCLYFHTGEEFTWHEANEYCYTKHSSSLEAIMTPQQHNFLKELLDVIQEATGFLTTWTRGIDIGSVGSFYYAGTSITVPDFIWIAGQPGGGIIEAYMYLDNRDDHDWNAAVSGDEGKTKITICQKDACF